MRPQLYADPVFKKRALATLAAITCALSLVAPAGATSFDHDFFPGVSLADLVDGDELESNNGKITFSNWEADVSGIAPENLKYYRVIPLGGGFRLVAPLTTFLHKSAELDLSYTVSGNDGLSVERASIAFIGIIFGGDEAFASQTIYDGDTEVASLEVEGGHHHQGGASKHDRATIDPALAFLEVDEVIQIGSGGSGSWGGHHGSQGSYGRRSSSGDDAGDGHGDWSWGSWDCEFGHDHGHGENPWFGKHGEKDFGGYFGSTVVIDHHYKVVPEPSTMTLVSLGITGFAIQRRRASRQRHARRVRAA
jgi:hypothetical protein